MEYVGIIMRTGGRSKTDFVAVKHVRSRAPRRICRLAPSTTSLRRQTGHAIADKGGTYVRYLASVQGVGVMFTRRQNEYAIRIADKVLSLKIKAADMVCLWRDHKSVAEDVELTWREVRALARAVQMKRR